MIIMMIPYFASKSISVCETPRKSDDELKAERNKIYFKNRIKYLKEGKEPFFYPTLNRFYFAKSMSHADKIFPKHQAKKLNIFRQVFYVLTGI